MKRYIFPLLLCVLFLGVNKTFAQNRGLIKTSSQNLYYVVEPGESAGSMHVMLRSPNQDILSVDLLNEANKVVMNWTPSAASHQYKHDFDLSKLPAGNYHVNINDGHKALLKSVSVASKDYVRNSGKQ